VCAEQRRANTRLVANIVITRRTFASTTVAINGVNVAFIIYRKIKLRSIQSKTVFRRGARAASQINARYVTSVVATASKKWRKLKMCCCCAIDATNAAHESVCVST
jgi:hypothetical protein